MSAAVAHTGAPDVFTTRVGPILLRVAAVPALAESVAALFDGYELPDRSCDSSDRRSHTLNLHLSITRAPGADLPRAPRFTGDRVQADRSRGWDATIEQRAGVTDAAFAIRDLSHHGPEGKRFTDDWVAGAVRVALALTAPRIGGLLLHAAALVDPSDHAGRGFAFTGPSGAGKTTMARRLAGWRVLSDDAALVFAADGWRVTGTPLPGRERLPRRSSWAPLAAIVHLTPNAPLACDALAVGPALAALLPRILYFAAPAEAVLAAAHALAHHPRTLTLASTLAHDPAPALAQALALPLPEVA